MGPVLLGAAGIDLLGEVSHDSAKYRLFGVEVGIEAAVRHARRFRDINNPRLDESVPFENGARRVQ